MSEAQKHYEELLIKYDKKVMKLESILTELEEWLNLEISIHDEDDTIDTLYSCVLDKIQELKEKYKWLSI